MRRKKNETYLDYIRGLPCVVCGDNVTVEAAHLRMANLKLAKRQTGMGEKPDDKWTLPLCGRHHGIQHTMGEKLFWEKLDIDPFYLALALMRVFSNQEVAEQIIKAFRDNA